MSALLRVLTRTGCGLVDVLRLSPRLEVDSLSRTAARSLGKPALQDDSAVEPLAALLKSVTEDLDFNHQGRVLFARRMVHGLRVRARLADREAAGELPETESCSGPLFITGFPRSGTTLSHRILSLAPDARFPTWCELMEPVLDPRLRRETARRRRLRKYRMGIFLAERLVPGLRRIHEIVADGPEECTHLHEHAFDSESMALLGPCTGYREWIGNRTPERRLERYRMHARCLRSIMADRPHEATPARWVLKAPQHVIQLDELFQTYPDARVVRMHRDPVAVIASTASLVEHVSRLTSTRIDLDFGKDLLEMFVGWQELADEGTIRHRSRVLDMHYDDLVSNPVGFVEQVHAFAEVPVDPVHLENVRAHLEHRPRHRWGAHRYSVERYGLTKPEIRSALLGPPGQLDLPNDVHSSTE